MPKTLIKSKLHSNKNKPKIKQEVKNTKSNLPQHIPFKYLNKNFYPEMVLLYINEFRRFSINV